MSTNKTRNGGSAVADGPEAPVRPEAPAGLGLTGGRMSAGLGR